MKKKRGEINKGFAKHSNATITLYHSLIKTRQFSSKSNKNLGLNLSDFDLNEWLRYFVDGENCFQNISYKK